jgi:predicted ATPase
MAELRRRKIFRIAAAYLAIAIPIIAFVDLTYDSLPFGQSVQEAVKDLVTWLLAVGFPVALALSWLFEWTPGGIVRDLGAGESAALPVPGTGAGEASADHARSPSLRELISSGPMSISRLLRLSVRISDLLARGHGDGRVHGELIPESILVSANDRVELPGFDGAQLKSSPGTDVDTSAYLAPECARGNQPDFRSDQFSLGAVLYEMATGRRAFLGANRDETLSAVLHREPEPAGRFNAEIPVPLQWALERCLAKRPEDRYASTRELHAELAAMADSVTAAISTRFAAKHNLPAQRTPLIGREAELEAVKRLALDKAHRLVTVTGAGGIGKTRLLIEVGRQLLDRFKGGVYFVPLDGVQDPDLVDWEIAKSLGVPQVSDRGIDEALKSHVRQHCVVPTLLLIDNFEHVLDAAPRMSELLAASEQLEIVVTSRAALRVYGEHEYRLSPLVIADEEAGVEQLSNSPAVRLFLDRAVSLPEDPDEESLRIVADICKRLDGLPLAIELAAARTRVLPLKGLHDRLQDPLELLSGGPRDLPARQRTLQATLAWSYELLDENLMKLFRRCGVFVGGATLEAIEAVCNVDEDIGVNLMEAVESLVDNSLLRPMESEGAEPRFTMLETMREYAQRELTEAGEEPRTRKAHAAYCLVLASESSHARGTASWEALYDRFDRESGNLRAALDWLIETGNGDWGTKLAFALAHYWLMRAQAREGYDRMRMLLPLLEDDSDQLMWAYCWTGDLLANMGRDVESEQYHQDALILAREHGELAGILRGLNALALNLQQLGRTDEARTHHEEALRIAREQGGSPVLLGSMLSNYADFAMHDGDFDLAQSLHEETRRLFAGVGDEAAIAWSLNRLGDLARQRGDMKTARARYEESLERFRGLGDKGGMAGCLYDFAALAAGTTEWARAEELNREALSIYSELGQVSDFPRVLEALSQCAVESEEPERGLVLAGSAAAMRQAQSIAIRDKALETVDRCVETARQSLSDADATTHWLTGWGMRPDQAIAYALRERNENLPEGL